MLDWDDLRFFLAVARHASLSVAAEDLKVAPSTVSRRLAALEIDFGVRLLNRTPEGYVLTLAGEEVREKAELIEGETTCLRRSIGNCDAQLSASVRRASPVMSWRTACRCFTSSFPASPSSSLPTRAISA